MAITTIKTMSLQPKNHSLCCGLYRHHVYIYKTITCFMMLYSGRYQSDLLEAVIA